MTRIERLVDTIAIDDRQREQIYRLLSGVYAAGAADGAAFVVTRGNPFDFNPSTSWYFWASTCPDEQLNELKTLIK